MQAVRPEDEVLDGVLDRVRDKIRRFPISGERARNRHR